MEGYVTGDLWAIGVGTVFALLCYRLQRSHRYVEKTVDELTRGRESPDPEKEHRMYVFGLRLALWWGFGLGLLMAGSGLAFLVVALTD